ncbi:hypothetical protein J6590_038939 [Homalodisca vitripennis]|nr:hypothetical protein J6590_038939 [Homalodisca vitripennis]
MKREPLSAIHFYSGILPARDKSRLAQKHGDVRCSNLGKASRRKESRNICLRHLRSFQKPLEMYDFASKKDEAREPDRSFWKNERDTGFKFSCKRFPLRFGEVPPRSRKTSYQGSFGEKYRELSSYHRLKRVKAKVGDFQGARESGRDHIVNRLTDNIVLVGKCTKGNEICGIMSRRFVLLAPFEPE